MNILYLGSPDSVHDLKWISFFSSDAENQVFFLTEAASLANLSLEKSSFLSENNISFLGALKPYSLLRPIGLIKSVFRLKKICTNNNIDIVHALCATPYAMWAYFSKKNYIVTSRGTDVMETIPELKQSGFKNFYLQFLYRIFKKAFINATYITSTSHKQVAKIREMFNLTNVDLVRTGVDVDFISSKIDKTNLPPQLQNCVYVNSPRLIRDLYNSKTQARAILMLDELILNKYTFVFYSHPFTPAIYLRDFEEILQKNKKIKYIIFNFLPQQNALACIKFASLNIMIPERDGTPNSALEAMAARSPLIVGNFAYDEDLFTDTCIRLKENTPEALAKTIVKALSNYPKGYLENAFQKVSEFGNRTIEMNKIKILYEKMITK